MKVLSLLQPWASALFIERKNRHPRRAAKGWETRSWKPSVPMLKLLQTEGMLIHASMGWKPVQKKLILEWPFIDYLQDEELPRGVIIGHVIAGEVITTEGWKSRFSHYEDGAAEIPAEEHAFGDYRPNRYAWEIVSFKSIATPVPCKGSLSLWDCPADILGLVKKQL